jgi:soluble lytic murein transglycosylase-like protein
VIAAALSLASPATSPSGGAESALGSELDRSRITEIVRATNGRLAEPPAQRIADAVLRCHGDRGLAPDLVLAVMTVESHMRPTARSEKGAVGLMQVMPHMFERLGLPGPIWHLETNVEAGCLLLADNIRRLGEADGISAYFWGRRIGDEGYLQRVLAVRRDLTAQASERRSG